MDIQLFKPRHSIGIDIGKKKIKIAEISSDKLVDLKILDTPHSDESIDYSRLAEELRIIFPAGKSKGTDFAISLPSESVSSVIFNLPPIPKGELQKIAINEVKRKMIPAPDPDNVFGYSISGEKTVDNVKHIEIIGISAPKSVIDESLSVFDNVDFLPSLISIQNFALLNSFKNAVRSTGAGSLGLIDIGATSTDITIVKNNIVRFFRTIFIGCRNIISSVARNLAIDEKEAEEIIKELGIPNPDMSLPKSTEEKVKMAEEIMLQKYGVEEGAEDDKDTTLIRKMELAFIMEPVWDKLIKEINRSFIYYKTKVSAGEAVNSVYLSGGGAGLSGIDSYFSRKLNMSVKILNPLQNLQPSHSEGGVNENPPQMATAIGLALQNLHRKKDKAINLLPVHIQEKDKIRMQTISLTGINFILAVILILVFSVLQARIHSLSKHIDRSNITMEKFSKVFSTSGEIKKLQLDYQKKIDTLEKLTENTPRWYDIFQIINNVLPKEVFLSRIYIRKEKSSLVESIEKINAMRTRRSVSSSKKRSRFSMIGNIFASYEDSVAILDDIISKLNESEFFKNAASSMRTGKEGIQIGVKKKRLFEITAALKSQKEKKE